MTTRSFAEQISALEASRAAKSARQEEIMQKAADDGRSTDAAEQEEFDTLDIEISQLDGDLKRLRGLENRAKATAAPVDGGSAKAGSDSRAPRAQQIRVSEPKLPPGIGFARFARCMALAQGNRSEAARIAEHLYGTESSVTASLKAAVVAGTTDSASWTGSLVGTESNIFADFAEFLRPRTIVGRFGADGIPALRRVPFRTRLVSQTGAGSGYWVGEANAKPLTAFNFADTSLTPLKVAAITVVSDELIRDSSPSAESILRDQLVEANRARLDIDFIDPTKTASAGVSPASITNGISLTAATGTTAATLRADIRAVMAAFAAASNPPTSGVWIMSAQQAIGISLLMSELSQPEFPGISMNGGTLMGLPVLTSEHVATAAVGSPPTDQGNIYLVNASDIYLADEGGFMVDMSREASLEMDDAPTQEGTTPTASTVVSLWQNNLVGLRAERTINWSRRRDSGVQGISGAAYGQ